MPKAIIIAKKIASGPGRGRPDIPDAVHFVRLSEVDLPANYKAYIVTGPAARLQAIAAHPNFLVGQQITWDSDDDDWNWVDGQIAIAEGAKIQINTWLQNNGYDPLGAGDSIIDLIRIFAPEYEPGKSDIYITA